MKDSLPPTIPTHPPISLPPTHLPTPLSTYTSPPPKKNPFGRVGAGKYKARGVREVGGRGVARWVEIKLPNDTLSHAHSHSPSHNLSNVFDGGSCATTQTNYVCCCSDVHLVSFPQGQQQMQRCPHIYKNSTSTSIVSYNRWCITVQAFAKVP